MEVIYYFNLLKFVFFNSFFKNLVYILLTLLLKAVQN
jgi:hypothetical protein